MKENLAIWVILAISPQMIILVILASHFRTKVDTPEEKKLHLGVCVD